MRDEKVEEFKILEGRDFAENGRGGRGGRGADRGAFRGGSQASRDEPFIQDRANENYGRQEFNRYG